MPCFYFQDTAVGYIAAYLIIPQKRNKSKHCCLIFHPFDFGYKFDIMAYAENDENNTPVRKVHAALPMGEKHLYIRPHGVLPALFPPGLH
jgi:hypothetical protein